jgi:hypothetical protein
VAPVKLAKTHCFLKVAKAPEDLVNLDSIQTNEITISGLQIIRHAALELWAVTHLEITISRELL